MRKILQYCLIVACFLSFFWVAGICGGLECDTMTIRGALLELPCAFFLMILSYKAAKRLEKGQKKQFFSIKTLD